MTTATHTVQDFYREFLMAKKLFQPQDFGVDFLMDEFDDLAVGMFREIYRDIWTIDELLLHPSEAVRFCQDVRRKHGWHDLPDDIILRVIVARGKIRHPETCD